MTGASVSTAVRSVVEGSCAVISMALRGKSRSQPSVETAPCGCVRDRQAQAVRGPQAPRPTGDGGATAPRAPARPAIVSLQGSIDQGRCFKTVDLLPSRSQGEPSTRVREAMIIQVLHCPYCQGIDIVRHGLSPEGKQRYRCRTCCEGRGRTFLLAYTYAGQSPEVKQQIVDMAMNASGIRDTARVLHVSPTTVLKELKKRNLSSPR